MAESSTNVVLRELMQENSTLSRVDQAGIMASQLIESALTSILEPGEQILEYADRELGKTGQTDAFAYASETNEGQTDAFAYERDAANAQTDALAYDLEKGREQLRAVSYRSAEDAGDALNVRESDAVAYSRPPENPQTNVFLSEGSGPQPAQVDILVLTDRRLMRGILEGKELTFNQVGCRLTEMRVAVMVEEESRDPYVAVNLPALLCGSGEGEWWHWRVPEGRDPWTVAQKWGDTLH